MVYIRCICNIVKNNVHFILSRELFYLLILINVLEKKEEEAWFVFFPGLCITNTHDLRLKKKKKPNNLLKAYVVDKTVS